MLNYLESVYGENYFYLPKIFPLKVFKMAINQTKCSKLKQKSDIRFLVVEKCKPYEPMRDVHRETCFSLKKERFTNGLPLQRQSMERKHPNSPGNKSSANNGQ